MAIDPLTLFLRLVVLVDRKLEVEIENCFYYELTLYPTALFKDGVIRIAKTKSTLKNFLLEGIKPTELTQRAKLLQMEVLYCGCVTGEKEKSSAKYLTCI